MNCLHCGKQLALFSKLRGEDVFCSGEHRELFFKSHQRFALDRLKTSSERLKARRHALLHPPADPDPASCGFVTQVTGFDEHDGPSVVTYLPPHLLASESEVRLPSYSIRSFASARMCGLLALPALSPLVGTLAAPKIEPEAGVWSSRLAFLVTGRYLDAAPLFAAPLRSRGVRLANGETAAMQEYSPDFEFAAGVPRSPSLEIDGPEHNLGQNMRLLGLGQPSTAHQPLQQSGGWPHPLASPAVPTVPPFALGAGEAAPVPVNRIFRARVRAGAPDAAVPSFRALHAAPVIEAGKVSIPASTPSALKAGPQAPSRWIDGRSTPVDGKSAAMSRTSFDSLSDHRLQPRMKASAAPPNMLVPPPSERFFKARPRGPVQGLSVPGWEPIETCEASWQAAAPKLDSLEITPTFKAQPQFLERVYRMRPRNPVPDRTRLERRQGSRASQAAPVAFEGKALLPTVRGAGPAPEPLFSEKVFRSRARAGVDSPSVPAFQPNEPQAATLAPVVPKTAESSLPVEAPRGSERLHNLGPAEGVADSGLSPFHAVQPPVAAFTNSEPVGPVRERPRTSAPEPAFLQNLFQPRVRSGVQDGNLADSVAVPAGQPHIPAPVLHHPATPVSRIRALAPAFIQRLFRPRLRAGVDSGIAAVQVPPSATPLERSGARYPATPVAVLDFEPAPLNRFFRPRPRGAVAGLSVSAFHAISSGSPEPPVIAMNFPVMPARLMRHNRVTKDKPIRMRPRPAVTEQADDDRLRHEGRAARQVG